MAGHVFISYSRTDRAYVDELTAQLVDAGIPVWYDYQLAAGDQFSRVIQERIDASAAFLVVLSPSSMDSRWVLREVSYAESRNKPVFPLQLAPAPLPIQLAGLQVEDVTGGQMPSPRFVARLRSLVAPTSASEATTTQRGAPEISTTAATDRSIRVLTGHTSWVGSVTWSPDARQVASAGGDRSLRIWDVATGASVRVIAAHKRDVWSVAWSPDGRLIATAGRDGTARLWDVSTGATVQVLAGHPGDVWSVAWSPDASRLLTAGADGTIRLWNTATGSHAQAFVGHVGAVRAACWSPDGLWIATAGIDRTVRIWNTASGVFVRSLAGHTLALSAVAWSPDGSRIATASADKTARNLGSAQWQTADHPQWTYRGG